MKIRLHAKNSGLPKTVWLNYHHLYYFYIIAEFGTMVDAAEHLALGQPTLSTQLKQFEAQLGTPLFERAHKKLTLNETGKLVQRYAREIFGLGTEMVRVLHDQNPRKRIQVMIGAMDSVPKHLTLLLAQAARALGNCFIEVIEGKGDALFSQLASHRIDLVLANFVPTSDDANHFVARAIGKSPIVICGAPAFKGLKTKFPQSLKGAPFVLPTRHSKLRHDLDHYFRLAGINIEPAAETQDTALQKLLGLDGMGLMALPEFAIQDHLQKKELIHLGILNGVYEEFFLIAGHRRIENPVTAHLIRKFRI